jgi:hypothetical protein
MDAGVDDQVGDMDAPRPELARGTLGYGTQTEPGAGESGVADPGAQAGGSARKEDVAAAARQHQARRLATGQEAISQTLRNNRSVVSSSGKLTFAPTLKTQSSSGAVMSGS